MNLLLLFVHHVCCCCWISIFSTVMSGFISVASCMASANALSWSIGSPSLWMVIFCSTLVSTTPSFSVLYLIKIKILNYKKQSNYVNLYFAYCYSFNSSCFARNGLCWDYLSCERVRLVISCDVYVMSLFSRVWTSRHMFGLKLILKKKK